MDAIVVCPNGFNVALGEIISKGLTDFIRYDEDDNPIGLNRIERFYPTVPSFDNPAMLYIRGTEDDLHVFINDVWEHFLILVSGYGNLYEQLTPDAIIEYKKYSDWDLTIPEEEIRTHVTLDVDDGNGGTVTVPNPKYMEIKPIGTFA